ncbi:MAG TPA: CAP domain-containing protein [Opitutaceae bacterium]
MRFGVGTGLLAFALLAQGASAASRFAIDRESLSAAILSETNRERAAHGLTPLQGDTRLARAADGHTKFLTLIGGIRHESFLPGRETVNDRVRAEGLKSAFVSENLALIPVHPKVIRGRAGGGGVEIVPGEEVDMRVDQLAAKFVRAWLDSPGHRENLLNPKFTHLGCAVQTGTGPAAVMFVYSAQVFARL